MEYGYGRYSMIGPFVIVMLFFTGSAENSIISSSLICETYECVEVVRDSVKRDNLLTRFRVWTKDNYFPREAGLYTTYVYPPVIDEQYQ